MRYMLVQQINGKYRENKKALGTWGLHYSGYSYLVFSFFSSGLNFLLSSLLFIFVLLLLNTWTMFCLKSNFLSLFFPVTLLLSLIHPCNITNPVLLSAASILSL